MQITIEMDAPLMREADRVAREDGVTLREVIEAGLRAEVQRRVSAVDRQAFRVRTVSGRGLRDGVDPRRLPEASYQMPS